MTSKYVPPWEQPDEPAPAATPAIGRGARLKGGKPAAKPDKGGGTPRKPPDSASTSAKAPRKGAGVGGSSTPRRKTAPRRPGGRAAVDHVAPLLGLSPPQGGEAVDNSVDDEGPSAPAIITAPDYIRRAMRYMEGVRSGSIDVCEYVRLTAERQYRDLNRQGKPGWGYVFDEAEAVRCAQFTEHLPHIKGPLARKNMLLEDWQVFRFTTVFGWLVLDNRRQRRFRRAYTEVPRGNGKSSESAGVGLFALSADKEDGAEIYSAATTRDQAKIVFEVAQGMARLRPDMRSALGVEVGAHSIYVTGTVSRFQPLSAEASTLDGLNIHIAIVDELHAHQTRHVYDVLETALGKRLRSMLWIITTAGTNRAGICYEVRDYVIKVLRGVVKDESQFGIIYTIDEGDDWTSPAVWRKANPNWGVSVMPDVIEQLANKAMQVPSAQSNFMTKHLNVWVSSDNPWLPMDRWDACADTSLKMESFAGDAEYLCYVGLDLASKIDIVARVFCFTKVVDGARHYYLFAKFYLPEAAVRESRNSQYLGWVTAGYIQVMPGDTVDFGVIEEELIADAQAAQAAEVGFDPWQATQLAQRAATEGGLTMVEVRPTVQNFSPAMKEIEAAVRDGRAHHDGNPVLTWMASNVVCHTDAKDNIFPRKELPQNKIDGMVAAITAVNRAMTANEPERSVYETRGIISL